MQSKTTTIIFLTLLNSALAYIYHGPEFSLFIFVISSIVGSAGMLNVSLVFFGYPFKNTYKILLPLISLVLFVFIVKSMF